MYQFSSYVASVWILLILRECHAQSGTLPANGITINITVQEIYATEGETVTIPANYISTPVSQFLSWIHENVPVLILPVNPVENTWADCTGIFTANCSTAGRYVVFVNNSRGNHFSKPVDLYVSTDNCRYPGSNTHCLYPPSCTPVTRQDIHVCEANRQTLDVNLRANPPVNYVDWLLNGDPINRTDSRYSGGDVTSPSLVIDPVRRDLTGTYSVVANNTVGSLEGDCTDCSISVTVDWPPEVNCTCSNGGCVVVNETEACVLPLSVAANPQISYYEWFNEGNRLDNSSGRYIYGSPTTPSLTVLNTVRGDSGTYSIFMNNTCGSGRCECCCTVQYPPTATCPSNETICVDQTVTLQCTADALPTISSVIWRKDGLELDLSSSRYSGGTVTTPSLTISPVIFGDGGLYECQVTNLLDISSCPVSLLVYGKPLVDVVIRDVVLIEGQTSSIGCSVDRRVVPPPVIVQWFKDAILVNRNSGRYDHGDVTIPSLTIRDIRRDDAGVYSCGAINAVGDNQSESINVVVQYPPVLTVKFTNYGVPISTNVTLWCSVDANPPVPSSNITWIRDGAFLLPSTFCRDIRPNLQFCGVETNTAGSYICRAENRLASRQSTPIAVNTRDECLTCVDQVRLVGGTAGYGRLEVNVDGTWGTVCGRYWTQRATDIVCSMLGLGGSGTWSAVSGGGGTGPIHIGHINCAATDTTLCDCDVDFISNCTHDEDPWIDCTPTTTSVTTTTEAVTVPVVVVTTVQSTTTNQPTTAANTTVLATTLATSTTCSTVVAPSDDNLIIIIILAVLLAISNLLNIAFCVYLCCCRNYKCKSSCSESETACICCGPPRNEETDNVSDSTSSSPSPPPVRPKIQRSDTSDKTLLIKNTVDDYTIPRGSMKKKVSKGSNGSGNRSPYKSDKRNGQNNAAGPSNPSILTTKNSVNGYTLNENPNPLHSQDSPKKSNQGTETRGNWKPENPLPSIDTTKPVNNNFNDGPDLDPEQKDKDKEPYQNVKTNTGPKSASITSSSSDEVRKLRRKTYRDSSNEATPRPGKKKKKGKRRKQSEESEDTDVSIPGETLTSSQKMNWNVRLEPIRKPPVEYRTFRAMDDVL